MDSLVKITSRTEIMPSLGRVRVYQLLTTFRDHCLGKYKDIYPPDFDKKTIDKRIGLFHSSSDSYHHIREAVLSNLGYDPKTFEPIDCLTELLRNPRTLKRSLAHTWSAWKRLHGEIYFDDLLIVHAIRATAPKLFELIASDIRLFRLFDKIDSKHKNDGLYQRVGLALKDYEVDSILYHGLIKFLFNGWDISSGDNAKKLNRIMYYEMHPQCIARSEPTDYFYRLNAEELSDGEQSDQKTMQIMLDINDNKIPIAKAINDIIENPKLTNKMEQFGKLFKPSKVLELTSQYFEIVPKYGYEKFSDYELTSALWRLHLNNPDRQDSYIKWLETNLTKYLQKNIRFANDIHYFWKYRSKDDSSRKTPSPDVMGMYLATLKKVFKGKPEKLNNSLPSNPPYIWVLRHILFRNFGNEEILQCDNNKTFFADWQPWFVKLLVEASKKAPKLIAMYCVPLVYDLEHIIEGKYRNTWEAKYDDEVATLLFGDKLIDVIRNISTLSEDDYSAYELESQTKVILDFAVVHSKKWLNDKKRKEKEGEKKKRPPDAGAGS